MKLRDIYFLCKNNVESIKIIKTDSRRDSANNQVYSLSGMKRVISAINELTKIDFLKIYCKKCVDSIPTSYIDEDSFNLSSSAWSTLKNSLNIVVNKVDTVIELYEGLKIKQLDGEAINVKLPNSNNYSDFVKYNEDLKFVLEQSPYLNIKDTKIEFNSVDVGSTWLSFMIVASSTTLVFKVLQNLVVLIDYAIIVNSHYVTLQQQKELLKRKQKETNEIESITKSVEELYKAQVEEELKKMNNKIDYEFKDGEEQERAKRSTETLGELISKGLEIRKELTTNQNIQKLFEPLEIKYLQSEKIELLENFDDKEK